MKKLATIFILLLIASIIDAQTVIIKANNAASSIGTNSIYQPWGEWKEVKVFIFIDFENETIKIDNQFADKFYIRETSDKVLKTDNDGDIFSEYVNDCYDKDGIPCTVTSRIWKDYNITHIYIYYSNMRYVYEGKIIEATE